MDKIDVRLPEVQKRPKLEVSGLQRYEDAIGQLREQVLALVQRGSMSEQVAARVMAESEYSFFQQLISVNYDE